MEIHGFEYSVGNADTNEARAPDRKIAWILMLKGIAIDEAALHGAESGERGDHSATQCNAENHACQNITQEVHAEHDARERDAQSQKE